MLTWTLRPALERLLVEERADADKAVSAYLKTSSDVVALPPSPGAHNPSGARVGVPRAGEVGGDVDELPRGNGAARSVLTPSRRAEGSKSAPPRRE